MRPGDIPTVDISAITADTVTLSWQNNSDAVNSFRIEQKIDGESHPIVKMVTDATDYALDPLKQNLGAAERTAPSNSGGLLMAFHQYRLLLSEGLSGFGRNAAAMTGAP